MVTKSHRSAASSSLPANARLASWTESRSEASMRARPAGIAAETSWRQTSVRGCSLSDFTSSGLATRTGIRVVGLNTPASETSWPSTELTRVDFPAPVDPPITTMEGISASWRRGMT